jgi:hypothetical protein
VMRGKTRGAFLIFAVFGLAVVSAALLAHPAAAQSRLDLPIDEVQKDLRKLFPECQWQGDGPPRVCYIEDTDVTLKLTAAADGTVETVEFGVMLMEQPRQPKAERRSREAVFKLCKYLLPTWDFARPWLSAAFEVVAYSGGEAIIGPTAKIEVLVQYRLPGPIAGKFARIYVTKSGSLQPLMFKRS